MTSENEDTHVTDSQSDIESKNNFNHEKGRPSLNEQLEIQRALRPYFENSISAPMTAQKTGFDIKTVNKYFKEWYKEITESETPDFIVKCKEEKARSLVMLENQICSLDEDKKQIQKLIDVSKQTGNLEFLEKFFKIKLKITETIGKFASARINLANATTADVVIEMSKKEMKKDGI